jgi:hypothetical protein
MAYNPKLIIMTATTIAATIKKKSAQPLIPWAVFFNGCPHFGHEVASFDTSVPHAGQLISAIDPPSHTLRKRVGLLAYFQNHITSL